MQMYNTVFKMPSFLIIRQIDGQMVMYDRWMDRPINRQIDRKIDRWIERQINKKLYIQMYNTVFKMPFFCYFQIDR